MPPVQPPPQVLNNVVNLPRELHDPPIIYYALAPTYPLKKLVSNTHKSDKRHRFSLL
jgi:hypothetical protein